MLPAKNKLQMCISDFNLFHKYIYFKCKTTFNALFDIYRHADENIIGPFSVTIGQSVHASISCGQNKFKCVP